MAEFDGISQFVKSAIHRLQDAEELMRSPSLRPHVSDRETRHTRGAVYIAGYAVECLVKAYLIEQEGCPTLSETQDYINK